MSTTGDQPVDGLTRDQLIAALDREIVDTTAIQASTGRTRWTLLITLAALIGLGIQSWETAAFSASRVVMLVLAMVTSWDLIQIFLKAMDNSPTSANRGPARFFKVSQLLGTFRSTLFIYILRDALCLGAVYWLVDYTCNCPASRWENR
jgi:hypothetical protein